MVIFPDFTVSHVQVRDDDSSHSHFYNALDVLC